MNVRTPQTGCEPVTVPLCQAYNNETMLPNFFGHSEQKDVQLAIDKLSPLTESNCSHDLEPFLCSLYLPECTAIVTPEMPCKNICIAVMDMCEPVMTKIGLKWPKTLDCLKFPANGSCIGADNTVFKVGVSRNVTMATETGALPTNGSTAEINVIQTTTPTSIAVDSKHKTTLVPNGDGLNASKDHVNGSDYSSTTPHSLGTTEMHTESTTWDNMGTNVTTTNENMGTNATTATDNVGAKIGAVSASVAVCNQCIIMTIICLVLTYLN